MYLEWLARLVQLAENAAAEIWPKHLISELLPTTGGRAGASTATSKGEGRNSRGYNACLCTLTEGATNLGRIAALPKVQAGLQLLLLPVTLPLLHVHHVAVPAVELPDALRRQPLRAPVLQDEHIHLVDLHEGKLMMQRTAEAMDGVARQARH